MMLNKRNGDFTFGVCSMTPKALKMSYRSFSSISGSKFPMNTLAPTSKFFVFEAAWESVGVQRNRQWNK